MWGALFNIWNKTAGYVAFLEEEIRAFLEAEITSLHVFLGHKSITSIPKTVATSLWTIFYKNSEEGGFPTHRQTWALWMRQIILLFAIKSQTRGRVFVVCLVLCFPSYSTESDGERALQGRAENFPIRLPPPTFQHFQRKRSFEGNSIVI